MAQNTGGQPPNGIPYVSKVDEISSLVRSKLSENSLLSYCSLIDVIFPDRDYDFMAGLPWDLFKTYADRCIEEHPALYRNRFVLWREAVDPEVELSEFWMTGLGVLVAVEAWCQHTIVSPSECPFTTEEIDELTFWQCYGAMIVESAFARSVPMGTTFGWAVTGSSTRLVQLAFA